MARKKKEPDPAPGSPAWMATFSDMVTLILTFFVLLYSFSSMEEEKWQAVAGALSGQPSIFSELAAVTNQMTGEAESDFEDNGGTITEVSEWEYAYNVVSKAAQEGAENIQVTYNDTEIVIRLSGDMLFDSGSAVLKTNAMESIISLLGTVTGLMTDFSSVRVEGHTDTDPISTAQYPDNKMLSIARAYSAYQYIVGAFPELDPILFSGGYGEDRPVADNSTPEGKQRNRRVEIVLTRAAETSTETISQTDITQS